MEGPARIDTFDYLGHDPATAPLLRMTRGSITPAEAVLGKRGASNAGYHYLGCARTFALMGQAFAQATLPMMKER